MINKIHLLDFFYAIITIGDIVKNRNGFTLIELLACIIIIALLATIAVPSALNLSKKVKTKSYESKISIMEQNAVNYGQTNIRNVRMGLNPVRGGYYTCKFTYDSSGDISNVQLVSQGSGYSESKSLASNEYWCFRMSLEELVDVNNLNWDETGACESCTTDSDKSNYDNIVVNPKTDYIINKCYMYLYYKNKRVYAYFDVNTCNVQSDTPTDGQEYRRKN
jgi:prepilin-type N-terminal cleavage/methylation domain-containing protein